SLNHAPSSRHNRLPLLRRAHLSAGRLAIKMRPTAISLCIGSIADLIINYTVAANLPLPARTAVNVVQTALKVHRSVAEKLLHDGAVRCRGRMLTQTHMKLAVGDEVEIDYAPQPAKLPKAKAAIQSRFEVVHDDEFLIVVNKPAG